jgi:diacylglycerol kinase (ATP)
MNKTGVTGLRRVWNAMFFSFAGLTAALKHESAFRQECALAVVMLPAAFWVGGNAVEYSLLVGSVMLVLIVELLNSAVEAVVDRVGTDAHTLSGQAKDMGSAAVFLSLLLVLFVWSAVIWDRWQGASL